MTPSSGGKGGLLDAFLYGALFTLGAFAMNKTIEAFRSREDNEDDDGESDD